MWNNEEERVAYIWKCRHELKNALAERPQYQEWQDSFDERMSKIKDPFVRANVAYYEMMTSFEQFQELINKLGGANEINNRSNKILR